MLSELQHPPLESMPLHGAVFDLRVLSFAVSAFAAALDSFGNLNSAVLFAATARACGPFDPAPGGKRPVSINALAASLGRPFETTRRHANALIDDGLIARSSAGLSVTPEAMAEPRVAQLTDRCHDAMVRLIEELHDGGYALPSTTPGTRYDDRAGVGIALDLMLAAFESHGRREENFTRLALLLAVERAERKAVAEASGKAAIPVIRTSTAAHMLNLPYATASRNIDALVEAGLLTRAGTGLRSVESDGAAEARAALANRARQLVGRLAQIGFPIDRPAIAYIHGSPAHSSTV